MSTYNFDFQEAVKATFGFQIGFVANSVIDNLTNKFEGITVLEEKKPMQIKSQMGVPVWDYVKLLPKIIQGTGEQFDGYDFPLETITEVSQQKKIVETDIFGSDGMVEELMGLGDWNINIKGFIINYASNDYPEFEVRRLRYACELKDTDLEVESTFLNLLNINALSIHKLNFPPSPGYKNLQAFEIECRSKKPFVIDTEDGILL